MPDTYTTYALMANDAPNVFIARRMIELLNRQLVLQKIADPYSLPNGNSKSLRVTRVSRLNLPTSQLSEGITPATNNMTLENVDVTVEQWGIVAVITDMLQLTVKHNMLNIATDRVARAIKEASEREDALVLMNGTTNVTYPGAVGARGSLAASDVMNTAMMITMQTKLYMRGAPDYGEGQYMCVMQAPHTAALLASDTVFQQASNFAKQERLEYGYVGRWMGLECIQGNFLPILVGVAAPTTGAITTTKAQYTVGLSGTLSTANYQLQVVGREVTTDYERRLSVQTGNIAVTSPGSIAVTLPSSTNYVYDIYMTKPALTVPYLVASRQAASSTFTITTDPAGTETVGPTAPASGVTVYPGFVCGKGAFGTCVLDGMSLQTFLTPDMASDSDPLKQRRKVGAKVTRKSFILDANYIERFETSSAIAAPLPA